MEGDPNYTSEFWKAVCHEKLDCRLQTAGHRIARPQLCGHPPGLIKQAMQEHSRVMTICVIGVCISLSLSLSASLSLYLSIYLSIYLSLSIYIYIYVFNYDIIQHNTTQYHIL